MSLLSKLFRPAKPRDPIAAERIRQWVNTALVAGNSEDNEIVVTISELECNDASCPGTETIVLIMRPYYTTKAIKFTTTMDLVTQEDVEFKLADFMRTHQ